MITFISPVRMNGLKTASCLLKGRGRGEKPCDTETGNERSVRRPASINHLCFYFAAFWLMLKLKTSCRHFTIKDILQIIETPWVQPETRTLALEFHCCFYYALSRACKESTCDMFLSSLTFGAAAQPAAVWRCFPLDVGETRGNCRLFFFFSSLKGTKTVWWSHRDTSISKSVSLPTMQQFHQLHTPADYITNTFYSNSCPDSRCSSRLMLQHVCVVKWNCSCCEFRLELKHNTSSNVSQ